MWLNIGESTSKAIIFNFNREEYCEGKVKIYQHKKLKSTET